VHDKDATNYASSSVFDDLAGLRKAQKITVSRKAVLINVKVDKPPNNVHFRAHPEWYIDDASILQDRDAGTFYFVHPVMRTHPKSAPRIRYVTLAVIFLWPSGVLQIWPVPKLEGERRPVNDDARFRRRDAGANPRHRRRPYAYRKGAGAARDCISGSATRSQPRNSTPESKPRSVGLWR